MCFLPLLPYYRLLDIFMPLVHNCKIVGIVCYVCTSTGFVRSCLGVWDVRVNLRAVSSMHQMVPISVFQIGGLLYYISWKHITVSVYVLAWVTVAIPSSVHRMHVCHSPAGVCIGAFIIVLYVCVCPGEYSWCRCAVIEEGLLRKLRFWCSEEFCWFSLIHQHFLNT